MFQIDRISCIIDKYKSKLLRVGEGKLPDMTDMLLLAELNLAVTVKETFLLTHAQLSLVDSDLDESSVSARTKGTNIPRYFEFASYNNSLLEAKKSLSERMIDIGSDNLISILFNLFFFEAISFFLVVNWN